MADLPGRINTVLFDLDDTLHDDTLTVVEAARESAEMLCIGRSIDAAELRDTFIRVLFSFWQHHDLAGLRPGENVRARMWQAALSEFGIDDAALANRAALHFEECRKKHYRIFPEAADTLALLRRCGVRLGLVTNGLRTTHLEKLEILQMRTYFDEIFLSDEVGISKPDPAIFLHACDKLGTAPERAAMVGDRYDKDVVGALRAGLYAVWLRVRNDVRSSQDPEPTFVIDRIEDVYAVLGPYLERY